MLLCVCSALLLDVDCIFAGTDEVTALNAGCRGTTKRRTLCCIFAGISTLSLHVPDGAAPIKLHCGVLHQRLPVLTDLRCACCIAVSFALLLSLTSRYQLDLLCRITCAARPMRLAIRGLSCLSGQLTVLTLPPDSCLEDLDGVRAHLAQLAGLRHLDAAFFDVTAAGHGDWTAPLHAQQ